MVKKLSPTEATQTLGIAGDNTRNGQIRADEFLSDLRGKKAINKFREMRDNDSTIGAVMYATEQVLRDVNLKVEPANDTPEAQKEADFVKSVLDDMEHHLMIMWLRLCRHYRMVSLGLKLYINGEADLLKQP